MSSQALISAAPGHGTDLSAAAVRQATTHVALPVFLLLSLFGGLNPGLARTVSALFAVEIHASPGELGLLGSCQSIGFAAMALPAGVLARRFGPVRMFLLGSVVAALVYVAMGFVSTPLWLIVGMTVTGFAMPLRFGAMNLASMRRLEIDGPARAGWYRASHQVAMFLIGPTLAVALVPAFGYQHSWWLVAASFLPAIALAPRILSSGAPSPAAREPAPPGRLGLRHALGLLAAVPALRRLSAAELLNSGTVIGFSAFIIAIAMRVYHFTPAVAAALLSLQAGVYVGVLFLLGWIPGRLGRARQLVVTALLVSVALVLLAGAGGVPGLWFGTALLGLGAGLVQVDHLQRSARLSRRHDAGGVAGVMALSSSSGGLVTGLIGGALGEMAGMQALFIALIPMTLGLAWWQWHARSAVSDE